MILVDDIVSPRDALTHKTSAKTQTCHGTKTPINNSTRNAGLTIRLGACLAYNPMKVARPNFNMPQILDDYLLYGQYSAGQRKFDIGQLQQTDEPWQKLDDRFGRTSRAQLAVVVRFVATFVACRSESTSTTCQFVFFQKLGDEILHRTLGDSTTFSVACLGNYQTRSR